MWTAAEPCTAATGPAPAGQPDIDAAQRDRDALYVAVTHTAAAETAPVQH